MKERLDKVLVSRGLCGSRERARALIMAGQVLVNETVCDKAGTRIADDAALRLRGADLPYVSRGGLKLAEALRRFELVVSGRVAIDVGASTGGFTDCLLQQGASRVYAVDVGYGQLAWSLRSDDRVVNLERTHICALSATELQPRPDLAVIDASFISLEKIVPATLALLLRPCDLVALIKPQFEVGAGRVGKGGIVRDGRLHDEVIERIQAFIVAQGGSVAGLCDSPVLGAKGNREFLLHACFATDKAGAP